MHTDSVVNWILQDTTYLSSAIARNFEKWDGFIGESIWIEPQPIPQSYEEEISTMINWITNRLNWMDNNMPGDCANDSDLSLDEMNSELNVYPNPAHDILYFECEPNSKVTLSNLHGKPLHDFTTENKRSQMNLKHLSSGTYFIHLKHDDQVTVKKILIR